MYFEQFPGITIHPLASDETKTKAAEIAADRKKRDERKKKWSASFAKVEQTDDDVLAAKVKAEWKSIQKDDEAEFTSFAKWIESHCIPELQAIHEVEFTRLAEIEAAVVEKLVSIGFANSLEGRGAYPRSAVNQHVTVRDQKDLITEIEGFQSTLQELVKSCTAASHRINERLAIARKKTLAMF
ncbi:hypothetical protein [Schlesneria sp. T3-172]|uniref:hypothetical protein n=1 Tax=Schlesneria sphaerica TaxID=3373610 RepID=UPI0037CBEC4C